ncbi:hypothetical protein [Hyphobacterium sp.]|uniref:hypothetical protein n=1 Tax=Hyphobacterium sp. TaxID=2004662 RepID=UPI003B51DB6A
MLRIIIILALAIIAASVADAQQRATLRAAQVENDTRFTTEFQESMESGNYGQAARLVRTGDATFGSSAPAGHSNRLSISAGPSEPAEYTCNGGNCACAGASDCVAMAPICEDGTIGCNDYGCTCKEAD